MSDDSKPHIDKIVYEYTTPYTGELPIPKKWWEGRIGESISVQYRMDLEDLVETGGVEGMNDYLDSVSGVVLSDITYTIVSATPGKGEGWFRGDVLIQAEGTVEEF